MSERWYVAVLVVSSKINGKRSTPTVDFQIRVFKSSDDEAAFIKANELGAKEEHSYENSDGETVSWHFDGLHDLQELSVNNIEDGTEVYSMLNDGNPRDYIMPKDRLTVFWVAQNKDKTAKEILSRKNE